MREVRLPVSLAPLLAMWVCAAMTACGPAEAPATGFSPPTAERVADGGVRVAPGSMQFLTVEAFGASAVPTLIRAPGRVAFRDGAVSDVGAPVAGRVTTVAVALGQRVRRGDPLLTIASQSAAALRAETARAVVLVGAAAAEVARQRQMSERGVGVPADLAAAEARAAEARAQLAGLRSALGTLGQGTAAGVTIRAPIDGVVLARNASVGLAVEPGGASLLTLGEPTALRVVAETFERDLSLVRVGASATVTLSSLLRPLRARVEAVGAAVDPESRRAPVYLTVLDDTAALRAGMYATSSIEAPANAAPGLPVTAILVKDEGRTVVYAQAAAETFVPREVRVGQPVDGRVPVLSGIAVGERVVTRGALLLDGAAEMLR